MNAFRAEILAAFATVSLLAGCAADDLGGEASGFPDGATADSGRNDGGSPDGGCVVGTADCPLPTDLAERCAWLEALPYACTDLDGDCHPERCEEPLTEGLDCDDRRADVHPSAPDVCDEVDNDCDGRPDEGLDVGAACDRGCGEGKLECSVRTLGAVACSTDAGQSQSMVREEICNEIDDDCDGQIDEMCRLDWAFVGESLTEITAAGPSLVVVSDGALWRVDGSSAPVQLAEGPVAWPTATVAGTAWLEPGPEGCPQREATAGAVCPGAQLKVQPISGAARSVGIGDFGAPAAHEDAIWWHAELADGPVMQRAQFSAEGIELPHDRLPLTDPAPAGDGLLGALEWTDDRPIPVARRPEGEIELGGSGGRPGPMALSNTWAVWPTDGGAGLWAVALGDRVGAQVVTGEGPHRAPQWAAEATVLWLSGPAESARIEALDLLTGAQWTLVPAAMQPAAFAVSDSVVYFISAGPRVGVFRVELPGG